MISLERFMGGATTLSFSSDTSVWFGVRCFTLKPSAGGLTVDFPDTSIVWKQRYIHEGGPHFYIWNDSAFSVDLRHPPSTVFLTLPANKVAVVWFEDRSLWEGFQMVKHT